MSSILILIVTVLYALTSASYFWEGHYSFGIVFAGYAFANIGMIIAGGSL